MESNNKGRVVLTGLKKRQQIQAANRMIFVWIIVASIVVSLCAVTIQFLVRDALFNQKIIAAKAKTQSTLDSNIRNVSGLRENVKALLADPDLTSVKADASDTGLKVVLDALPVVDDRSALASSLQQIVLPKSGVAVNDLTIISDQEEAAGGASTLGPQVTSFDFGVTGNYDQIKTMLKDIERTIRPLNITTLSLQGSDATLKVTVGGETYYLPAKSVELKKETIKP